MKKCRKKNRIIKKAWKFFEENTSPIIVAFSFIIVLVFSIIVILLALKGIELSSTLIEYFYKFFGFELLALSGIKISKHIGSAFGRIEEVIDGSEPVEDGEDNEIEGG